MLKIVEFFHRKRIDYFSIEKELITFPSKKNWLLFHRKRIDYFFTKERL